MREGHVVSDPVQGSCQCGAVTWEFDLPIKLAVMCHCTLCRKLSGTDYSSHVFVAEDQFRILAGEDQLSTYDATPDTSKSFCKICGSPVVGRNNKRMPGHVVVGRGSIDSDVDIRPSLQVFTESKGDWVTIHDDIKVMKI